MKLKAKQSLSRFTNVFVRYRIIIIWLIVLCLLGFTLWRLQAISDPQPDTAYMERQRNDADKQIEGIRLSEDLRRSIDSLRPNPVDVDPGNLGTQDPFNP